MSSPAVAELATRWVTSKRPRTQRADGATRSTQSDRARIRDLCAWGLALSVVTGRDSPTGRHTLDVYLAEVTVDDFTIDILDEALRWSEQRWSPSTVRRMVSTFRGFYMWCARRGHLTFDPLVVDELQLPASGHVDIRSLDQESYQRLLDLAAAAPQPAGRWWPPRDRALVLLAGRCGLRLGELVDARWGWWHVGVDHPILRVVGKGGKPRNVPVPLEVRTVLEGLRDSYRAATYRIDANDHMLLRVDGRPLSASVADKLVRDLAGRAGIELPGGAATHSLRHFYGATLAGRGVPLSVIAQLMGHSDVRTTLGYTRIDDVGLSSALEDAGLLGPSV